MVNIPQHENDFDTKSQKPKQSKLDGSTIPQLNKIEKKSCKRYQNLSEELKNLKNKKTKSENMIATI